jgi:hypothetical protein
MPSALLAPAAGRRDRARVTSLQRRRKRQRIVLKADTEIGRLDKSP